MPSKCEAGSQKCCKDLAKTKLDLRNAANSLQIEGKGVLPGDPTHLGGGRGGGETEDGTIYIYISICVHIYMWVYMCCVFSQASPFENNLSRRSKTNSELRSYEA